MAIQAAWDFGSGRGVLVAWWLADLRGDDAELGDDSTSTARVGVRKTVERVAMTWARTRAWDHATRRRSASKRHGEFELSGTTAIGRESDRRTRDGVRQRNTKRASYRMGNCNCQHKEILRINVQTMLL